jgi:hypothetical protein
MQVMILPFRHGHKNNGRRGETIRRMRLSTHALHRGRRSRKRAPWRDHGRNAEVCDLLAPMYGWFTAGVTTERDLQITENE